MKNLFFVTALIISVLGSAQTGAVKGTVYTFEEGVKTEVPFVNIWAIEAGVGTKTGFTGEYMFNLPIGKNTIAFSPVNLDKDTIIVDEKENGELVVDVEFFTAQLKVVTIIAKGKSNELTEVFTAKATQEDTKVTTKKTAKQIEEGGDSNIGSGAKKMTGMSTVGDVLYVRGLGDRYNVAYLNGLPVPSPNPDFRVVPLNLFPTAIVSSVSVSKVMSSELYGDFSGGAFNIITKSYLDKPSLTLSVGTGGNSQTIFKDFRTYSGGKTDYFGVDDGTRQVPDFVVANSKPLANSSINNIYSNVYYNSVEGKTTGFADNFGTIFTKAMPNTNFSISGGNFMEFPKSKDKSSGIGFLALLDHSTSFVNSNGNIKLINAQSEERLNYDIKKYTQSTATTAMISSYLRINPDHNITFNSLLINTSTDEVRDTWGSHFDYAKDVYSNRITYNQNYVLINQLIGTHKFLKPNDDSNFSRLVVDWRGSYNFTGTQEPDRRQIVMFYDEKDDVENYSFNFIDKNENHRFFSELNESEIAGKVNVKYIPKFQKIENKADKYDELIVLNVGGDYKSKVRNFDYKQFNYILNTLASTYGSNANVNNMSNYLSSAEHDNGQFYIQEIPNSASSYRANLSVYAGYFDAKFKFNKLEIVPGLRTEISNQTVINRNQQVPSIIEKTDNNSIDILPSFIMKYSLTDKDVLRLVGSKTITRPKFNELAPFQYTLFFAGMKAEGNPELGNSQNYNFDARYERYPRPGEMITLGAFYKYIDSPIEQVMKATASGQLMSYANALSANVAGLEFEFVRNLSFLVKDQQKRDTTMLRDFAFGFNTTYMYSQVQIDTNNLSTINTNSSRPLEGASPFLINFSLKYDKKFENKNKLMLGMSYNVFGKRLVRVGSNGIGDSYALPVNSLNLISKFKFENSLSIGFKLNNVLNPAINIVQEDMQNVGERINVSNIKTGVDFSFSLAYTFKAKKK
jgi:hypothetical protein